MPGAGLRLWSEPFLAQVSDLEVAALVATSDQETLVLFACDLLWVPDTLADRLRATAARALDTSPSHVLVNASHAHSTPALPGMALSDPTADLTAVTRFGDRFIEAALAAVRSAGGARRESRMGVGWGTTPIGVYRRAMDELGRGHLGDVPDRAIDRSVGVIRFDDLDGAPIGLLFTCACHPVLYGPRARAISSDFPGAARALVEHNLGGVALFLQGCGGDVNPRFGIGAEVDPHETTDREGTVLGTEVLRLASEIRTNVYRGPQTPLESMGISVWPWLPVAEHPAPTIAAAATTISVPLSDPPSVAASEAIRAGHRQQLQSLEAAGAPPTEQRIARRWAEWSEVLVVAARAGRASIDVPIQVCRIGDVAFVGVAMELFSDTGVDVRAVSPFAHTLVLGYTNGYHGYLPRAQDLPLGGWSPLERYALPDHYPQAWLQPTAVAPEAEKAVVDAVRSLLEQIA